MQLLLHTINMLDKVNYTIIAIYYMKSFIQTSPKFFIFCILPP